MHIRVLLGCAALAVCMSLLALISGLNQPLSDPVEQQILLQLRLPNVLTAIIVGASLSVSSAALQVLLRNPLADPGIIGISSGASLCAAMFLLLPIPFIDLQTPAALYWLPSFCLLGALFSTGLIYMLSKRFAGNPAVIVLAGIGISTLCGAVVAWLHLFADANSTRTLLFWLMGSLSQADWWMLSIALPVCLVFVVYLILQGGKLNWCYFGTNSARLIGLNVRAFNRKLLIVCALLVGVSVALAGSIAFVGLIIPHLLRNFFGHDNRIILPASAFCGAALMTLVSFFSQFSTSAAIPVSMLTASIGAPIFLYSLTRLMRH